MRSTGASGPGVPRPPGCSSAAPTIRPSHSERTPPSGSSRTSRSTTRQLLEHRMLAQRDELPEPWRAASMLNGYALRLTPDELRALGERLDALIRPVHRPHPRGPARGQRRRGAAPGGVPASGCGARVSPQPRPGSERAAHRHRIRAPHQPHAPAAPRPLAADRCCSVATSASSGRAVSSRTRATGCS